MEINWKWVAVGVTAGVGIFVIKRYMAGGVCRSRALMTGKTVIVTGANCGIGKATATELAKRRARVILACRDLDKANAAVKDIRSQTDQGVLIVKTLDLASFRSIKEFAAQVIKEEPRIDVLINNAGVYGCPFARTEDGLEIQMGVNHFGHFLLTNLLLDKLKSSAPSRVVVVSSGLHKYGKIDFENFNSEEGYDGEAAYKNSKLANNLFARELTCRLEGTGVSIYCLRPGMVRSNLGRHVQMPLVVRVLGYFLGWLLVKSPYEGCQTVLHCAIAEEVEGVSGNFYGNCKQEEWTSVSLDDEKAKNLWEVSERLTKLKSAV